MSARRSSPVANQQGGAAAELRHGAEVQAAGGVHFRLWAPAHDRIELALEDRGGVVPMRSAGGGWHEVESSEAGPGTLYRFVLPDGLRVPDPASRFQPADVHGPSEVIDLSAHDWTDGGWSGRPWHEAVLYELHIGAFTESGTFRAAIDRLDHLAALGATAIGIMPVADFPGKRNWGYDGVLPYAPDSTYGRPEDLKALVEAAHARRLMVLLDVVYNHFGPDGNYLPCYAPEFFTDRYRTPWGAAINYDGRHSGPVRGFVIQNALYWINEFHFDGLRLDAVHAIIDHGPKHILDELALSVHEATPGRHVHLVLENERNQASRLTRSATGMPLTYTAQWNDDAHHVLHVAATGESKGYYADYLGDTCKLGRALAEGFAFQGEVMKYRGKPRGEPSAGLPPDAFIAFIQNHDQVGNRAFGDRIGALASVEALRAIAAVYLLLPEVPMLFMGEEWSAAQPFPFFCDFTGDLAEAVRKGRRGEFARFPEFQDEAMRARIPDPEAETTFESAKLRWEDLRKEPHATWLAWYRRVLAIRHKVVVPLIAQMPGHASRYEVIQKGAVLVRWRLEQGGALTLAANLSAETADDVPLVPGCLVWQEGEIDNEGTFRPWAVRWTIENGSGAGGAYGGPRASV